MSPTFARRRAIEIPVEDVEAWHHRPGALHRLLPPWEPTRIEGTPGPPEPGSRVRLRAGRPPLGLPWVAEHRSLSEGRGFRDVQVEGPFQRWEHEHRFRGRAGGEQTVLEDRVDFRLPGGPVVNRLLEGTVRRRLARAFEYRHRTVEEDLRAHRSARSGGPWRVAVTGSSGLVGAELVAFLRAGGHRVLRVVRGPGEGEDEIGWDPASGLRRPSEAEGLDALVHLAGEPLTGLWTGSKKAAIARSRRRGTRILVSSLRVLDRPPEVLVSASAVGYYGDRGNETLTEASAPGEGFLADVCREWEEAAREAEEAGIRVVRMRFGIVLSGRGGALAAMLPAFRLGLGATLGDGRQWMAWIGLDDLLDAIHFALDRPSVSGAVNAVAPRPVRHGDYVEALGRVLSRPVPFRVPSPVLSTVLGEMADDMLLASGRVVPEALAAAGFSFRRPGLEATLRHQLGRPEGGPLA